MTPLHPKIAEELQSLAQALTAQGALPAKEQLDRYYSTFRLHFGPDALRGLDGEELLERMHAHGSRDSMVYWLEFKDDEEFPALFGSIAGGSALKFGVYKRAETGGWAMKGSGAAPRDIPTAEAIAIAQKHRDQLLAGCGAVAATVGGSDDERYAALQGRLEQIAPDVQDTAWGHKYFSLIFPDLLDDFHVVAYQQYHLVRMLQLPPNSEGGYHAGRYVCAGRYVALAEELGVPLKHLTILLNRRNGAPRKYWRVGTKQDSDTRAAFWPLMRDASVMGVGWPTAGDLSERKKADKDALAAELQQRLSLSERDANRAAAQLLRLVIDVQQGDRVVASDGQSALGVGEVRGPYVYVKDSPLPHQREVIWNALEEWRTVDAEPLETRIAAIRDLRNHVEIERRLLDEPSARPMPPPRPPVVPGGRRQVPRLTGVPGQIQSVLERKGQVILYGPPGTGKTYWAIRTANELAARRCYGVPFDDLNAGDKDRIVIGSDAGPAFVRTSSFHPEYGYEDFIEGYRPIANATGQLAFHLRAGAFRKLCDDAAVNPEVDFFLIIDEINRGDIPRIFGELLTLLERDKRGHPVELAASGAVLRVPTNVHVIGTMNTADRSIALLDIALRRRFGFVELMPDYSIFRDTVVAGLPLGAWLEDLNSRIRDLGGSDARNRQIGHAFFLDRGAPVSRPEQLSAVLRDDIVPLLEEYCYDDFNQLVELLGAKLVDPGAQRVRRELFDAGRIADLVAALMRPEITTAVAAVTAESELRGPEEEEAADDAALP